LYPAGALSVIIGWVLLSPTWWKTANGSGFVPLMFVLSAVTGLVGQIVARAASLFVVSGVIFGAAMVGGAGFCWCSAIAIAGTLVIVGFLRVGSGDFSLSYDHSDQAAA